MKSLKNGLLDIRKMVYFCKPFDDTILSVVFSASPVKGIKNASTTPALSRQALL
jgi:hypothetical protein